MRPVAGPNSSSRRSLRSIHELIYFFILISFVTIHCKVTRTDGMSLKSKKEQNFPLFLPVHFFASFIAAALLGPFSSRLLSAYFDNMRTYLRSIIATERNDDDDDDDRVCARERECSSKKILPHLQWWNMQLITIGGKRRRAFHRHFRSFDIRKC